MNKLKTPNWRAIWTLLFTFAALLLLDQLYAHTLGKHPDGDCLNPRHFSHPETWHDSF
jgi:hypothetical protein